MHSWLAVTFHRKASDQMRREDAMASSLAVWAAAHAPLLLGVLLAVLGRLVVIVAHHLCDIHLLHECQKAASELATNDVQVLIKHIAGRTIEISTNRPADDDPSKGRKRPGGSK
jgi:beta-lactamase regulating signal transducer with metallopeptidase domain